MINFKGLFGPAPEYINVGTTTTEEAKEQEKSRKAGMPAFQVGSTVDGRVTLTIGDYHSGGTLTMTDGGVDQLIRMLEAAKHEHNYTDVEDENT